MTTTRLLRQAAGAMRRYPLRTGFTMLGSLIGIAALTFVVSLGQGAEAKLLRTIRQIFGDASILVIGGGSRMLGSPRAGAARLTIDDLNAVAGEVPGIEVWDPQAETRATVRHAGAVATVRIIGESERWQRTSERAVARGQSFDATAVAGSARVALIGATVARALFANEDPLDAEIRVGAIDFRVIGVLEPYGVDMHGMDRDNEIVVPITTFMRRVTNVDAVSGATLLVRDPAGQRVAAREITRVLRRRHAIAAGQPDDFRVMTAVGIRKMVGTMQRIFRLYLPLASGVVLLVGGIVAATLMLTSVSERVAEIGIRLAVGARAEDIRDQFLVETVATVVAGGAAGLVLGYVLVGFVGRRMQLGTAFSWTALAIGLSASLVVGLLAGVAPARRAARLNPVDALR